MKTNRKYLLFLLPGLCGVIVMIGIPFLDVIRRSMITSLSGKWVGLQNYNVIFHNQAFLLAAKNTLRFTCICLPLLIVISFGIALILSSMHAGVFYKIGLLFPFAVPAAAVVMIWRIFFDQHGMLNGFLHGLGFEDTRDWMNSNAAFWILVGSYLWKNMGYTVILWLAGILDISDAMTEAAKMDGANSRQIIWYIMLPNLSNTMYMVFVISFVNSFHVFREAYLVSGSYPHQSIYLLQHLFNNWLSNLEMDKMAAAAVVMVVVFMGGFIWMQKKALKIL